MRADDRTHLERRLGCLQHCGLYRRTINLTCPRCQRVRRYDAVALWWLFHRRGWDDALPGAWRRLYCTRCKEADGQKVRPAAAITRNRPDDDQPPYPDEATWKRVVSRYRS